MRSRIGYHFDSPPTPEDVEQLKVAEPEYILVNIASSWGEGIEAIKTLLAGTTRTKVIIRHWKVEQSRHAAQGKAGAHGWLAAMREFIDRFTPAELRRIYWTGLNEWQDSGMNASQRIAAAAAFCAFEIERSHLLKALGTHSCAFNHSLGTPGLAYFGDPEEWPLYEEALRVLEANGDILGLHEYYWPDHPVDEQDWICGRWRVAWDEFIGSVAPNLIIVITEFGFGVFLEPKGWKGELSESEYVADIIKADETVYNDPRIGGFLLYLRHSPNINEWWTFNIDGAVWTDTLEHIRASHEAEPPPTPPTPTPEPEPPAPPPPLTVVCPTCDGRGWIEAEEEQMTSLVTTARLYMRTGPSKAFDPIRVLALGEPVTGLERINDWWRVRDKFGVTGYSHGDWLKQVSASTLQPVGRPHVGAGTADPGTWAIGSRELDAIRTGRFTCIKVMCPGTDGNTLAKLRSVDPNLFIVARLFGNGDELATGARFAEHVRPHVRLLYASGVRYFECHNEPNLPGEGMGRYWQDGKQFAQWLLSLRSALRPEFPDAKFGFPGLSPAPNYQSFIDAARDATFAADWLACHVYWATPSGVGGAVQAATQFAMKFAPRHVMVTEFSRQAGMDKDNKAQEYLQFVNADWPANMIALIGFVLSASSGWESETWVGSNIPQVLAQRRM